jgi:hypothetical protein
MKLLFQVLNVSDVETSTAHLGSSPSMLVRWCRRVYRGLHAANVFEVAADVDIVHRKI